MKKNINAGVLIPLMLIICLCISCGENDSIQTATTSTPNIEVVDLTPPQQEQVVSFENVYLGKASVKQAVIIDGEPKLMLTTFDEPEKALEAIANANAELFSSLEKNYRLSPFSDSTCQEYIGKMYEYMTENQNAIDETFVSQQILFQIFIDIYENDDQNVEITNYVNGSTAVNLATLREMLPEIP